MPVSPEKQLERKRKILAATREYIKEVGYANLNVRELADRCGVSVPTLYNQFQSKDQLIYESASEIYLLHMQKVEANNSLSGLDRLIYVIDSIKSMVKSDADLCRLLVKVMPKNHHSIGVATNIYKRPIVEMHDSGGMVDWVDPNYIGKRVYEVIRHVQLQWANGRIDDKTLMARRRIDALFLMLGVTKGKTQEQVSKLLQRDLASIGEGLSNIK